MDAETPEASGWKSLMALIVLAIVVAGAASFPLYRVIDSTLQQHAEALLSEDAAAITSSVDSRQARYDVIGGGIGAYVLASQEITSAEWQTFAQRLIASTNAVSGFTGLLYAPRSDGNRYIISLTSTQDADAEVRGMNLAEDPRFALALVKAKKNRTYTLSDPAVAADGTEFTLGFVPVFEYASASEPIGMAMVRQASGRGQRVIVDMFDQDPYVPGVSLVAQLIAPGASLGFQNSAYEKVVAAGILSRQTLDFNFGGRAYHADLIAPHGMAVPLRDRILQYSVTAGAFATIFAVCMTMIVISRSRRALSRQVRQVSRAQALTLDALEDVKTAKVAAETERQYLQTLMSSLGEGVISFDKNGLIKSVNPAGERLLGQSEHDLVGAVAKEKIVLLKNGVTAVNEERPLSRFLANPSHEKVRDNSFDLRRPDGVTIPISAEVTGVFAGTELAGIIATLRDITLEREIDTAKTEFASLASHQMKAPLGVIRWYTELLSDAGPLTEEQKKMLAEIVDANQRMLSLVESLLSVTRMETGSFAAEPVPLDIAKVVHTYIADNTPAIISRGLHVTEQFDPLPTISMDERLLGVIAQNLISNSVRYTKPGGSIDVSVRSVGNRVSLAVTDTGIGIPPEAIPKLYDKGYRTDEAQVMESGGTGLGLYLVKKIIDVTGGDIAVSSVVGKGTTFTVTYPLTGMIAHKGTKAIAVPESLKPLK